MRNGVKHKIHDYYDDDMRAVEIETARGPLILATMYWPPKERYSTYARPADGHKKTHSSICLRGF